MNACSRDHSAQPRRIRSAKVTHRPSNAECHRRTRGRMRVARRFFLRELLQRHRAKRMRRGATPDGSPLEVGPAQQLGAGSRASLAPTESLMAKLYESLTQMQRREICFDWDYRDAERGLLRTFIANHWQVTQPCIRSKFFTRQQRAAIRDLFKSLLDPAWHD